MNKNVLSVVSFLLAFTGFVKLDVVGSLSLSEIFLLVASPFCVLVYFRIARSEYFRSIFLSILICLAGQMISDFYREIDARDYTRGWAKIVVMLVSFLFFSYCLDKYRRLVAPYVLGVILSPIASLLVYGTDVGSENIYKFYIGGPVIMLILYCIGVFPRAYSLLVYAPYLAAALSFYMDARSLAGLTILSWSAYLFWVKARNSSRALGKRSFQGVGVAIILICLAAAVFSFYKYAAAEGVLGEAARNKIELQTAKSGSEDFSILSGRSEVFFSWPKIAESPLIGHGSWAKDWGYVYGRALELGMSPDQATTGYASGLDAGLIPSHSHFFGAWMEAGILGAILWIVVIYRVVRLLLRGGTVTCGPFGPVLTFMLFFFLWDILFSPFGGDRRMYNGFILAWVVLIEVDMKRTAKDLERSRGSSKRLPSRLSFKRAHA